MNTNLVQKKIKFLGASMMFTCPECGAESRWEIVRITTYRHFPLLIKKSVYLHICPLCKYSYEVSREDARILRASSLG